MDPSEPSVLTALWLLQCIWYTVPDVRTLCGMYHATNQLYPQPPTPSLSFPLPPSLFCFISGTELNLAHSSVWGKISALVHAWHSLAFQSSPPFLFRHCWYSGNVFEVVSVSYCCCNTWPHMGWLKTTQIYYLTAPEVRILRGLTKLESSIDRVVFLWEA